MNEEQEQRLYDFEWAVKDLIQELDWLPRWPIYDWDSGEELEWEQQVIDLFRTLLGAAECALDGHDIEDDGSYGGPEGGDISLRCSRCGWSLHVVLY